ncbi:MAG: hypothetical protein R8G34_13160 [Paracoccaceae bacterium]|nr:hypothetical protein [Paracoccaceae bacterium]
MLESLKKELADPTKAIFVCVSLLTFYLTFMGVAYSSMLFYLSGYNYLSLATPSDMIISGSASIGMLFSSIIIAALTYGEALDARNLYRASKESEARGNIELAELEFRIFWDKAIWSIPPKILFFLSLPVLGAIFVFFKSVAVTPVASDAGWNEKFSHWSRSRGQQRLYVLSVKDDPSYDSMKYFIFGSVGDFTLLRDLESGATHLLRSNLIQVIRHAEDK